MHEIITFPFDPVVSGQLDDHSLQHAGFVTAGTLSPVESTGSSLEVESREGVVLGVNPSQFIEIEVLLEEDFEDSYYDWYFGSYSGVNTATSNSGEKSAYVSYYGTIESPELYLYNKDSVNVSFWIRKGAYNFSDPPDYNEYLEVEYYSQWGGWSLLDTFYGTDPDGKIYKRIYELPDDAYHSSFRLRFQNNYGDYGEDYWHIDDVRFYDVKTYPVRRAIGPQVGVGFIVAGVGVFFLLAIAYFFKKNTVYKPSSPASTSSQVTTRRVPPTTPPAFQGQSRVTSTRQSPTRARPLPAPPIPVEPTVKRCIECNDAMEGLSCMCEFCKTDYCIRDANRMFESQLNCKSCNKPLKLDFKDQIDSLKARGLVSNLDSASVHWGVRKKLETLRLHPKILLKVISCLKYLPPGGQFDCLMKTFPLLKDIQN
ncbi:MAG: hypothetical protein ACFFCS_22540 [Candidatus Hodarchaeota archaeon]